MLKEILDLHGNKFEVLGYKLELKIPILKWERLLFTRDYISGESFNLGIRGKVYRAYFYNYEMDLYVSYKLKYLGYDESKDIRKSYLYGKRKNN